MPLHSNRVYACLHLWCSSSSQFPQDFKEVRVRTGCVSITFSSFDIPGRMKWTPSWTPKWTMWHGRNRGYTSCFTITLVIFHARTWEGFCFFFFGGDRVQRAFKQRCGQEANDDLDAAVKTVRDMVSSLRLDVDARRRKAFMPGGSRGIVRWSTEDVVCLLVLLTLQIVYMIAS